jgi:uncharacterized membrane protein YdjX (TVP38/TMEM64 family)
MSENVRPWLKGMFLLVLVLGLAAAAWTAVSKGWLDIDHFESLLRDLGPLGPLVFILVMALAVVTSLIPSLPLDVLAGAVFGPWLGTLYALIGAEIGALLAFVIAKGLGREAIVRLLKKDIAFCDACAERQLAVFIFIARLIPLFSFELISYGAGLTKIPAWKYALATLLGMAVPTFLFVSFGKTVFAGFHPAWAVAAGLAMVVLLFVGPIWIKRKNPWGLFDRMNHSAT